MSEDVLLQFKCPGCDEEFDVWAVEEDGSLTIPERGRTRCPSCLLVGRPTSESVREALGKEE